MCEFISAVEKDKKIYFLTAEQVLGDTARAKAFREHCKSPDDYLPPGHGAIRWYYNLEGGTDREYTDFSSPANFPTEIAESIKRGEMRGLGIAEELLMAPAWKAYQEATASAWEAYREATASAWKACQWAKASAEKAYREATAPAWKAYREAMAPAEKAYQEATASAEKAYREATAPAEKAYREAMAPAEKAYQEATASAEKAYREATASAWKAYQEATALAFWDLFALPENRPEAWR